MLKTLKAKFIAAFGSLILLLFVGLGVFMIDAKEKELTGDISVSTQNFTRFAVEDLVDSYSHYLAPGNFLAFSRDVSSVLRQNSEISAFTLATYSGDILFDSNVELTERYAGPKRVVSDVVDLDRFQSNKASLLLEDGRLLFVNLKEDRSIEYVDFNEEPVPPLGQKDRIRSIVVPYDNAYAALFEVNYSQLDQRLALARNQIFVIALVGLFLTLMLSYMLSVSVTNPLKDLKEGALKLSSGDFNARVPVRTKDELGVLAGTFNQMAKDLEESTEAKIYQERVQKELELATQIQTELLPQDKLSLQEADIAGGLISATEVGGDAFDYIPMKDGRFMAYLADVTGHGVPAGIISSIANALLYGMRGETDPVKIMESLNEVLVKKTLKKLFITMGLIIWDEHTGLVSYVSAGHPAILHYEAATQTVKEITQEGIALGLVDDLSGKLHSLDIQLQENDVLVLYSDGVPEAEDEIGKAYGLDRLKAIVADAGKDLYTAEGIKNAVLTDVTQYVGKHDHKDDMTVLVLKRKSKVSDPSSVR